MTQLATESTMNFEINRDTPVGIEMRPTRTTQTHNEREAASYQCNEHPKLQARSELRKACIGWLTNMDNRYHLTITFAWGTNRMTAEALLNRLLRHLNRRIYKARYDNGLSYIAGFAVREPSPAQDGIHYHIVIRDRANTLPNYERFKELISKEVNRFKGRSTENRWTRKKWYIDRHLLQEYFNDGDDRLEEYVTKELMDFKIPIDEAIGAIGVLNAGSVQFGGELLRAK